MYTDYTKPSSPLLHQINVFLHVLKQVNMFSCKDLLTALFPYLTVPLLPSDVCALLLFATAPQRDNVLFSEEFIADREVNRTGGASHLPASIRRHATKQQHLPHAASNVSSKGGNTGFLKAGGDSTDVASGVDTVGVNGVAPHANGAKQGLSAGHHHGASTNSLPTADSALEANSLRESSTSGAGSDHIIVRISDDGAAAATPDHSAAAKETELTSASTKQPSAWDSSAAVAANGLLGQPGVKMARTQSKGMSLPFKPMTLTFKNISYYVDIPKVSVWLGCLIMVANSMEWFPLSDRTVAVGNTAPTNLLPETCCYKRSY